MNDQQRAQVRENAKYLHQVRPIDPEEIHQYIDGQPHPAAVRQVLREEAPSLELLEQSDGRFAPVESGPVDVQFDGVETVPESISRALEDLLVEQFGPGWPDGESGEQLRTKIRDFKRRYLEDAPVTYDETTALGYAIYHLPPYFATTQYVFAELADDRLLPRHLRILDVGAGVGGPALGIDALVPDDVLVEYHAVEPSDAVSVLDPLLDETGRNVHPTVHNDTIEAFDPGDVLEDGETFDVVLFANVLAELDDPEDVVCSLLSWLDDEGSVVALSPADRKTAIQLREIERTVESEAGVTVYAPTVRLWQGARPASESWSFRRHPSLEVPAFQKRLDEGDRTDAERERLESQPNAVETAQTQPPGSREFVNVDVQYAYSILRPDGTQRLEFTADRGWVAKMAEMDEHVTDRIDCVGVKLSHNLADEGNPLYLVGDGSEQTDHFAVLTSESALNSDLAAAAYGDLLMFENVLVLWNDDEQAYNLIVDGETVVDRLPA